MMNAKEANPIMLIQSVKNINIFIGFNIYNNFFLVTGNWNPVSK